MKKKPQTADKSAMDKMKEAASHATEKVEQAAGAVKEKASEMSEKISSMAGAASEKTSEKAAEAKGSAEETAEKAKEAAGYAKEQIASELEQQVRCCVGGGGTRVGGGGGGVERKREGRFLFFSLRQLFAFLQTHPPPPLSFSPHLLSLPPETLGRRVDGAGETGPAQVDSRGNETT